MCQNCAETMYDLLSYEPYSKMRAAEREYVELILQGKFPNTNQYASYHTLFSDFIRNYRKKDFKWLKNWKNQYHAGASKGKKYYPVLFRKICFYLIIYHNEKDAVFFEAVELDNRVMSHWKISSKDRRMRESQYYIQGKRGAEREYKKGKEYKKLQIYRSGLKQEYIMNIVQDMYFEWRRQYAEQEDCKADKKFQKFQKPLFVDVFCGTGTVATNIDIPSDFKVLNDFDQNMVCMIFMLLYYRRDVAKRLCNFHNKYIARSKRPAGDYKPYTQKEYKSHLENTKKSEPCDKKVGRYYKKLIINARNLFNYCEWYLENAIITERVFDKNVNINNSNTAQNLSDKIEIAACSLYYMSFKSGFGDGGSSVYGINLENYKKYMETNLKCNLEDSENSDTHESTANMLLKYKAVYVKNMLSDSEWKRSLRKAFIVSFSFEELFSDKVKKAVLAQNYSMKDIFYYLDSPYFLTKQYRVTFTDDLHKKMLDCLRDSEFKWVFSMKYKKGSVNTTSGNVKGRGKNKIKDYLTYYKGFLYEFKLNGKVYEIDEEKADTNKNNLFVILFDYISMDENHGKFNKASDGQEILIANFDSSAVIPYKCEYVQLPFEDFLKYVEENKDYAEVVRLAYGWRKRELINKHGLNIN